MKGMIMRGPAVRWQDASPTGNGEVGAMMYGQIRNDIILLNHEALYYPRGRGSLVDVSDQLPEVRRLIEQGKYNEAWRLMPRVHAERGGTPDGSTNDFTDPYQPFCDIRLRTETNGPFRHYRRGVDFETGRVWIKWEDDDGTTTRDLFVSRYANTVFLRISSDSPIAKKYRLSLRPHDAEPHPELQPATFEHYADNEGWIVFKGRFPGGYAFGALAKVSVTNGLLRVKGDEIVVDGANSILLQARLFTHEDPDDAIPRLRAEIENQPSDFDKALADHSAIHAELFNRMSLNLFADPIASNELALIEAYDGTVPTGLLETMFNYGRYLMVCSNRSGGWPANLQGVWNGEYAPPWNSDIHTDENIQMNYWAALPGNLPEVSFPFFDYFERHIDDYRENAKKIYGCRGILVPIAQTTHGRAFPCVWTNWISAAGWLGQLFYDFFAFTGDRDFLAQRTVPWLKETALFYEDFTFEGTDGKLLFTPSLSPENVPPGEGMDLVTINATMDVAVCREVLSNLCDACELLDIERDGVERWREMLAKLPEYEVNEDGAMREWLHPRFKDKYHHRHQSHIYPLFPGLEITEETNPKLYEACRIAIEKRLVIGLTSQSGWSMAHMANVYARLGEGNRSLECLEILLRSSTGPNLFTYHNDWRDMGLSLIWGTNPPFQIDANFGLTAAVLEMLVFSKPGLLKFLPSLPDNWPRGIAKGLACRGGITLDLEWDLPNGSLSASLTSKTAQEILVKLPAKFHQVSLNQKTLDNAELDSSGSYACLKLIPQ